MKTFLIWATVTAAFCFGMTHYMKHGEMLSIIVYMSNILVITMSTIAYLLYQEHKFDSGMTYLKNYKIPVVVKNKFMKERFAVTRFSDIDKEESISDLGTL